MEKGLCKIHINNSPYESQPHLNLSIYPNHSLRKALTLPFRLNSYSTAISGPDPTTHEIREGFSITFRELGKRSKIVFYAVFWKITKRQKPVF